MSRLLDVVPKAGARQTQRGRGAAHALAKLGITWHGAGMFLATQGQSGSSRKSELVRAAGRLGTTLSLLRLGVQRLRGSVGVMGGSALAMSILGSIFTGMCQSASS